jgi:hypothetical protein
VAYPNILILEPDIQFAHKLQKKLRELDYYVVLKTQLQDVDELLDQAIPIHTIILNIDLGTIEGYTVYSYLKERKLFKDTTFIFLANNHNIYMLLKEMPLERARVVEKNLPFEKLIQEIINFVPLHMAYTADKQLVPELSGDLSHISARDLLEYCRITFFSGTITFSNLSHSAKVFFEKGTIKEILFRDFSFPEALEAIQNWSSGHFVMERKPLTVEEIKDVVSEKYTTGEYKIELTDLFIDVFHFLYQYLSLQIPTFELHQIIESSIAHFNQHNAHLQLRFDPISEDVFAMNGMAIQKDVIPLIGLVADIFEKARKISEEIDWSDYFDYLQEIKPYLDSIHFFELLDQQNFHVLSNNPSSDSTEIIEKVA